MIAPATNKQPVSLWPMRLIGGAVILMGVWFITAHFISWSVFQQQLSFWSRCLQVGGGFLHVVCGIGLLVRRNWARYLFVAFMLWHLPTLYKTTLTYAFRLMRGYVFLWYVEVMTFFFLIVAWTIMIYGSWIVTRPSVRADRAS